MDQVASSLQKTIQDNFRKLNLYGQTNVPEVMCSCSVFKGGLPVQSGSGSGTNAPPQPGQNVIITPSQFVPGEKNDGTLLPIDPGNTPFILPQGMTPDDILMEQAAAIAPMKEAAEKKAAAAAAATGATAVATESGPEGSAVAVAVPGGASTAVSGASGASLPMNTATTTVVEGIATPPLISTTNMTTEKFAPFYYEDDGEEIPSYRESLPLNSSEDMAYVKGAQDMFSISMFSWCIYIVIVFILYFFIFGKRSRNY